MYPTIGASITCARNVAGLSVVTPVVSAVAPIEKSPTVADCEGANIAGVPLMRTAPAIRRVVTDSAIGPLSVTARPLASTCVPHGRAMLALQPAPPNPLTEVIEYDPFTSRSCALFDRLSVQQLEAALEAFNRDPRARERAVREELGWVRPDEIVVEVPNREARGGAR